MAISLFGFEFKRKEKVDALPSFTPKEHDDGAVMVAAGGAYGTYVDLDGTIRTEAELVTKYREMSLHPECDSAIDEIINETMSIDEETIVDINLDNIKLSDNIKNAIRDEFHTCLKLLDFNKHSYDIFRRWYVDGRLYYHIIVDEKKPAEGIKEIRFIDPRKIRKIREVQRKRIAAESPNETSMVKTVNEYFIFNDKGFNFGNKPNGPATNGLRIAKDSILHIVSGLTDNVGTMVLSYLHKAIKALNQLRTLEDALVIYRLSRAPERRIWYIDVGNLPKMKAEQYVRDIMVKHKNRLIYDASSGEVRDDRKFMTMLEDYWLPRREGGRGTEVTTLAGGQNLGQMDDVLYFQKKFLQCLNVPVSRLNSDALFSVGRATEITRDEIKFNKFVVRLRARFAVLFTKLLEKQVVLKEIMTIEDWQKFQQDIKYDYSTDVYFAELKDAEIMTGRIQLASMMQDFVGKYYSHEWLRREVLHQTDEQIKEQDKLIKKEQDSGDPRWMTPEEQMAMMGGGEGDGGGGGSGSGEDGPAPVMHAKDPTDEDREKHNKLIKAKDIYLKLKEKKENMTPQEYSKFQQAAQILAKSKSQSVKSIISRK